MFPQGGTQWKVLECLLIKMSHLEQKINKTIKGDELRGHKCSFQVSDTWRGGTRVQQQRSETSRQTHEQ